MGHFGARLPSAAPAPPVGDASTGYGHSPPWPARWVRPWLHLGEHLLHGGDFGLLVCDDAAGEGLGIQLGMALGIPPPGMQLMPWQLGIMVGWPQTVSHVFIVAISEVWAAPICPASCLTRGSAALVSARVAISTACW